MIDQTWTEKDNNSRANVAGEKVHKVTLQATKECWATEKPFSSRRSTPISFPVPKVSSKYTHTSNTIWTTQIIFRNTYAYTYAYIIVIIKKRP